MSALSEYDLVVHRRRAVQLHTKSLRLLALGSLGIATLAYLSVLFHVTNVVGGRTRLLAVVIVAFLAAFGAAKTLTPRVAAAVSLGVLAVGMLGYVTAIPAGFGVVFSIGAVIRDWLAILSGFTVLGIVAADVWAAAFAPAPIFLSWYLAFRGEYAVGATVVGAAAGLFMLSSDLSFAMALLGVLGIAATVGFGELARRQAALGQADLVVMVLAVMLVASILVPLIPAQGSQPITPGSSAGGGGVSSLEQSLIGTDQEVEVSSRPSLDPSVRFTVSSPIRANWRVDAYDRYTGTSWVQTGESGAFDPTGPPGERVQEIEMAVRPEQSGGTVMPTMWQPVDVAAGSTVGMTPERGLVPAEPLTAGEPYFVSVERPEVLNPEGLDGNESAYPDEIEERYTRLPDSTPAEVGELTSEVVADADGTFETASRIEQYLIATNNYSLDVSRPTGDIAYEMLFERDAGYCTFFATTMVAMLRTQDIPARFVTGYSAGEQVDTNEYVVRGMNAHAWVEVYVPEMGWVEFDPTPSGPYSDARQERLDAAREAGDGDVDIDPDENFTAEDWEPSIELPRGPERNESETTEEEILARSDELEIHCGDPRALEEDRITAQEALVVCGPADQEVMGVFEALGVNESETDIPPPSDEFDPENVTNDSTFDPGSDDEADPVGESSGDFIRSPIGGPDGPGLPSAEQLGVFLALGVAAAVGVRRSGLGRRVRHEVALRWQGPVREPRTALERAWQRLELHLSETTDPRRPEETVATYAGRLVSDHGVDDRIQDVASAYERARYSDEDITTVEAAETARLVDELVERSLPRLRR